VELQHIVTRYAEALAHVDATTTVVGTWRNAGKIPYQPGIQPMVEEVVVPLIDKAWEDLNPGERAIHSTELPYPTTEVPATTQLDHVFSSDEFVAANGGLIDEHEWGIEVKRLQFVGDNGKNGDHEVAKILSPYLKDRGMLHDALRLLKYGFTERVAVVGYAFDYNVQTLAHARTLHTNDLAKETIKNIAKLVASNGPLYNRPLVEFADSILRLRGWTIGPRAEAEFEAWKHPAGGTGIVFGWEIRRPHLEPDYDPRHPW
jgi:hypothetical protein